MMIAKHFRIGLLCSLAWLLSLGQLQAAASDYVEPDFSEAVPVRMEILQDGGKRRLGARFVRPSSDGVEIEMIEGEGAIIVGWDYMEQFTINIPMTPELERALSHRDPRMRVEMLKNHVWPLLPLASIRSESTNVHILINAFIEAVIESEDWLRGYDISQYMALNRSPADTVQHLYSIAENLFVVGEREKALRLVDQLIDARPGKESRVFSLRVAKRMLGLRLFEPALRLFQSLTADEAKLRAKRALLNCAYLSLELGEHEEAERYLSEAKQIEKADDDTIAAEYLYYGVQAFMAGESNLALNHLAHAMAVIPQRSHLNEVGFYFNYLCYSNQAQPEIAQSIFDEMDLLFPNGAYLANLKEPTTETNP
ncbi:MAG: tetratricopeptide repeat protein [Opitutaceae bacterium]